ncbi:MAG: FAD:protein FMN transferase [Bacteroidales bacterium]|nr:FAD:protein FMN transferase [Candidatus Scybalocola fimicaballi]
MKATLHYLIIFISAILLSACVHNTQPSAEYVSDSGRVFGTFYNIKYKSNGKDVKTEYLEALANVDTALSTFNKQSTITRVNLSSDSVLLSEKDSLFLTVYNRACEISTITNGAFDITVAPLVNAYGFGYDPDRSTPDSVIAELKKIVGWKKVVLCQSGYIKKENPQIKIDASAIAKGFGSDEVARVLRNNGINDFMVEVGGEVVCSGVNDKGNVWSIGINKPIEDSTMQHTAEIQRVVQLDGKSLATSGNYLQYYYKDGVKYAHTIDPRSGKPVCHTLLSSSIIADDCMTADALATSCMVLGVDSAMSLIESLHNVEGYFIYSGENGEYLEKQTNGFKFKQ